ncbi:LLM class flavin-dependent oxidoreductase [Candidatus Leptofilum sp.]|uniref:LLM class flavin-dependent oxidoreductase n=1 Tax=Candidatus Leptofilum sp. TaxID=3241576 RepID=UPI003B5B6323
MSAPTISIAFQTDKPLNAYGRLAQIAENYSFDGITVYNDLLYQPAWLPLLEIARATSRVRVGPAAVNPFTCHPINIAANIALIDEMSNGRSYLGFARGAWLDFVGLQPQNAPQQLREAMACVRHLLQKRTEPLPGDYFPLAGGEAFRWTAVNPNIPFLLGSWGQKTIAVCRPLVDEIKLGGTANPGAVRWLRQQLAIEGSAPDIVVGAVSVVSEDRAEALTLARREVALYLPIVARLDPTLALDLELVGRLETAVNQHEWETAVSLISDELLKKFALAGTPSEIGQQTLELLAAGANRVEFGTPHGITSHDGLCLLGKKVLPIVRKALT